MKEPLILGADAGGTNVKFVLMTASGAILRHDLVPTDPRNPEQTLSDLAARVRRDLTARSRRDPPGSGHQIRAIGLACAGIVSAGTGMLGRSPNLPGWEGLSLQALVERIFGPLPVVLSNDVNAALYGEWCLGSGRGCRDLVMIALGTGVGGGVMVGGRLVLGRADGAGEIGHMVLDLEGPVCTCGNRGCLEAYAGEWALLQQARVRALGQHAPNAGLRGLIAQAGDRFSAADLHRLAEAGDKDAREIFHQAGRRLGQAVGTLINVLDPDRVIIGGGVAQAADLILAPCRELVRQLVLAEGSRQVPIVPGELGRHAAALGAACLAREGSEE